MKVRALNLANSQKHNFEAKNFKNMSGLHFLVLDGCKVSGNLGSSWEGLRWLQWRRMPMTQSPRVTNLANLVSLGFSESTELAEIWVESNPALEVCMMELYCGIGFDVIECALLWWLTMNMM